jgi:gamma-glutamylcyclotransferase (GGCT)/AIG2-like uncharacterized protein YtfP
VLYFGYGSNLCADDLGRWCRERGIDAVRLDAVSRAYLPDRRLAFTHHSTTRGGGVLDVPLAFGSAVAGVLFRVRSQEAIAALDEKETRGHAYRRIETVALTEDGAEHPAFAYEVVPSGRRLFVDPAPGYLDVVRRGYAAHGLPAAALDAAARGAPHAGPVAQFFVYGTLRSGEERRPILTRHDAAGGDAATVEGTLLHLGDYPGLVLDGAAAEVTGEVYSVSDLARLFAELDPVETFHGFGAPGSLYRRAIVRVQRAGLAPAPAWTYVYNGVRDGARVIASGDWRRRAQP